MKEIMSRGWEERERIEFARVFHDSDMLRHGRCYRTDCPICEGERQHIRNLAQELSLERWTNYK